MAPTDAGQFGNIVDFLLLEIACTLIDSIKQVVFARFQEISALSFVEQVAGHE